MKNIIFLGGDRRMLYTAEALGGKLRCTVGNEGKPHKKNYDYAVLPLKKSTDGLTIPDTELEYEALGTIVKDGGIVFTGSVCPVLEKICHENRITLVNYLEREELAVANAVPTAEGALEIAIGRLPVTVFGCKALVTGFGRIAKILAKYLLALGAQVTVACRRKSDLKWAEIYGCRAADITDRTAFTDECAKADVIFNTVPFEVIDKDILKKIRSNTLYIDLASADGADMSAAAEMNIETITARGLPGKTAPVTAGRIIAEAILNILTERSDIDDT